MIEVSIEDGPDIINYLIPDPNWIAGSRPRAFHEGLESFIENLDPEVRVKKLRALPYKEYLKSEHWRITRHQAIGRAGSRCQMCGKEQLRGLNVHHLTYKRLGEEADDDLLVCCEPCHAREHGKESFEEPA